MEPYLPSVRDGQNQLHLDPEAESSGHLADFPYVRDGQDRLRLDPKAESSDYVAALHCIVREMIDLFPTACDFGRIEAYCDRLAHSSLKRDGVPPDAIALMLESCISPAQPEQRIRRYLNLCDHDALVAAYARLQPWLDTLHQNHPCVNSTVG